MNCSPLFLVSKIKEDIQKPKANPAPKNAKGAQGKANPAQFKAKPVPTKAKSPAKKLISPLKVKSSVQESSPVEKTDISKAKKVQNTVAAPLIAAASKKNFRPPSCGLYSRAASNQKNNPTDTQRLI